MQTQRTMNFASIILCTDCKRIITAIAKFTFVALAKLKSVNNNKVANANAKSTPTNIRINCIYEHVLVANELICLPRTRTRTGTRIGERSQ